jgi:hypothetical protein
VNKFKGKRDEQQRPREPELVRDPPFSNTFAQSSAYGRRMVGRRQSWEQLSPISDELGKWQPMSEGLPCWVRWFAAHDCHRTLRLRTPCGGPAKPEASKPRGAYHNYCAAAKAFSFAHTE